MTDLDQLERKKFHGAWRRKTIKKASRLRTVEKRDKEVVLLNTLPNKLFPKRPLAWERGIPQKTKRKEWEKLNGGDGGPITLRKRRPLRDKGWEIGGWWS